MSDEERLIALGRLIEDTAAAKRAVVALKGRLDDARAGLEEARDRVTATSAAERGRSLQKAVRFDYPTPAELVELLAEYDRAIARAAELSARVAALGI